MRRCPGIQLNQDPRHDQLLVPCVLWHALQAVLAIALVIVLFFSLDAEVAAVTPYQKPQGTLASVDADEAETVEVYFFFAETCPHCANAKAFLPSLRKGRPWLKIEAYSVLEPDGQALFASLMRSLGAVPEAVPTFIICGTSYVGFDGAQTTGRVLSLAVDRCRQARDQSGGSSRLGPHDYTQEPLSVGTVEIPLLGAVSTQSFSLPVLTLILGGLDAFNPCAFFVLLFLLSLLVNARSRLRMALVGGIFIAVSGLMYFLFMAAWLNLFLLLENVGWFTRLAGGVAIVIGILGIKDYFLFHQGPSLSISEANKDSLYVRVRGLLSAEHLGTLVVGAGLLAVAANMYELICTSGFPLVFTQVLTLHDLAPLERYGYLALYNVVYVVPLFVIVAVFVWTMGRHKLSERGGRILKLVSGLVMLAMGSALLAAPALMQNAFFAVLMLAGAILLALALSALFPKLNDRTPKI
jgi:hypothetical protein